MILFAEYPLHDQVSASSAGGSSAVTETAEYPSAQLLQVLARFQIPFSEEFATMLQDKLTANPDDLSRRWELVEPRLKSVYFKNPRQHPKVYVYGSLVNGLATKYCDIDCAIQIDLINEEQFPRDLFRPPPRSGKRKKSSQKWEKTPLTRCVHNIKDQIIGFADVDRKKNNEIFSIAGNHPLIRIIASLTKPVFFWKRSGSTHDFPLDVPVDISVYDRSPDNNKQLFRVLYHALLISSFCIIDPRIRTLAKIVKQWAKVS